MSRFTDWLTGKDLQARNYIPPLATKAAPNVPYPVMLPNPISLGTLVHGPGAAEAYREAYGGGTALNSAVYACIQAIQRTYTEAPVRAWTMGSDMQSEPINPHPVTELLNRPNKAMTGNLLLSYTQYCKAVYGNAYWRKVRGPNGAVVELWPLSPSVCWPIRRRNSSNFIDAYVYQFGTGEAGKEEIDPLDIVHFRWGLDDRDHKYGLSPLRLLVREADTDMQTTAFSDRLVRNNAVPGMVVSYPPEAGDPGPEAAERIKSALTAAFGGEHQGSTAVVFGGAEPKQFGFSPSDLDLTALHRVPEERISAVLGVPAIIAGLGAGLDRATYANFKEAREMFIEGTIIPSYADDDAVLTEQLLPEFNSDPNVYLAHDISDMRALQPDMDAMYTRLTLAVGGPWLAPNEARSEAGFPDAAEDGMAEVGGSRQPATASGDDADGDGLTDEADAPTPIRARAAKQVGPPISAELNHLSHKAFNAPDYEDMLRALAAGHEAPLEAALQTYFARQRRDVLRRYREQAG
jgi:HK97 family phage portal protein